MFDFENCSDLLWEKNVFVIEIFLRFLEHFFLHTVKGQKNFLEQNTFEAEYFFNLLVEDSLRSNTFQCNNQNANWNKYFGCRNLRDGNKIKKVLFGFGTLKDQDRFQIRKFV